MNDLTVSYRQILTRDDGATIAYWHIPGESPGVVFLHGLNSDKGGTKSLALMDFCRRQGRSYLAMDMFGHGESSGDFVNGTISRWTDDVVDILSRTLTEPQILVGSSMGGWVMLLVAKRLPSLVSGLIGIAAAPDFTEDLMWASMSSQDREHITTLGHVELPSDYSDEPYIISYNLIEDGRKNLVLRAPLSIIQPVILLHGQHDTDVPWRTSLDLQKMLQSERVTVTLVKDGDHRLSRPQDLALLEASVSTMLNSLLFEGAGERA